MKLFYKAGSCALAPHIVMAELNMVYELEAVNLQAKTCASGDYKTINPKGSVPALKMENGEILTEGSVISQYLADQKPEMGLFPKFGTTDRYRCQEWLNFIATEVHKNFGPFFYVDMKMTTDAGKNDVRTWMGDSLKNKMNYVSEKMGKNDFLMGPQFTIADAYLFTCLTWSKHVGLDLTQWSNITAFMDRVQSRPAVIRAMKEQGLL